MKGKPAIAYQKYVVNDLMIPVYTHCYLILFTLMPFIFLITRNFIALPVKNIKVINSFYKGMHDMQRCLRL